MNQKEAELLALIRRDPYLSQQEMADAMKLSRPSIANLISGLIREGKILGRAYVLPEEGTVICIGGANVDRKFKMKKKTIMGTSNPAAVTGSVGGVARNIAENLGRLGHEVKLLSIAGNDSEWKLIEEVSSPFMSTDLTKSFEELSTGTYTAVLEPDGEMLLAMANMDIYEQMTPAYVARNENALLAASCIVIDLNCPKETIEYVRKLAKAREIPLAVIPVSGPKMDRLSEDLTGITWLVLNRDEAEQYLGKSIETAADWQDSAKKLHESGAENVLITGGKEGVIAANHSSVQHFDAFQAEMLQDVTGAGDAFSSGVIHSFLHRRDFVETIRSGLMNATKTLQSETTVRTELTAEQLKKELEELQ